MRPAVRQDRLFRHDRMIAARLNEPDPDPPGHLGFGIARLFQQTRYFTGFREPVAIEFLRQAAIAHPELQEAVTLDRVEPVSQHQRLQRRSCIAHILDRIAAYQLVQA